MRFLNILIILFSYSCFTFCQFVQTPLPYAYNALEPFIDAQTMEIHYSKHHATYVKNLNAALASSTDKPTLMEIIKKISNYSNAIRNNAGGHWNHDFFWSMLSPKANNTPSTYLSSAIKKEFIHLDSLKAKMNKEALSRFGSGWVWLIVNKDNKLQVCSTPLQDNPLMDIADTKGIPILGIDVWEHAYYLKYQNRRNDYLGAIWNVINWEQVSNLYLNAVPPKPTIWEQWKTLSELKMYVSQIDPNSLKGNISKVGAKIKTLSAQLKTTERPAIYNTLPIQKAIEEISALSSTLGKLSENTKSQKLLLLNSEKIKSLIEQISRPYESE